MRQKIKKQHTKMLKSITNNNEQPTQEDFEEAEQQKQSTKDKAIERKVNLKRNKIVALDSNPKAYETADGFNEKYNEPTIN